MNIHSIPLAILAGGLATRLRPITTKIPKALVEVAGRPFIDHQLRWLHDQGVRQVVLCVGHLGTMIQEHLGDGRRFGVHVDYSFDGPKLLGTGGALRQALPKLGNQFWILYGDSYLDCDFQAIADQFSSSGAQGLMTVLRNLDQWDKSNVLFQNGKLKVYSKTSNSNELAHIDYGLSLLRREPLEAKYPAEPFDLAGLFSELVAQGTMIGYEVANRFYEIGSPQGLVETAEFLATKSRSLAA